MNRVGTIITINTFFMAYYNNTATVINNSQYTLTLDTTESSSNCQGVWPSTINNNGQPITVQQTGNVNMSFTAAYKISGSTEDAWIVFQYYNACFIGYHWSMSLLPGGNGYITGVSGSCQTSYDGGNYYIDQPPLCLSNGGLGGQSSTAETYVVDSISVMI